MLSTTERAPLLSRFIKLHGAIKAIKLAFARLRISSSRTLTVGRHSIELPPGHLLDFYKISHPNYDVHLQRIGEIIATKYPDFWAIDIGANIGDSAAAISAWLNIPTVCIEGDPSFYAALRRNAARIGSFVHTVNAFVGAHSETVNSDRVIRSRGTARIEKSTAESVAGPAIPMVPLSKLLEPYSNFNVKLLKVDTDGFDFTILGNSLKWIAHHNPVILFECDTSFPGCDFSHAVAITESLQHMGYAHFVVFDNYGNLLTIVDDDPARLQAMIAELSVSRELKRGTKYLDLYAFQGCDADLFHAFHAACRREWR